MKIKTNRKGFTIVELVIVIAVIGILSAVLIPTFSGMINKAQESAKQQGLTNAYTAYVTEVDAQDLVAKDAIYLGKTATEVYKFNVATGEWTAAEAGEGKEFQQIGEAEYNGYKQYKIVNAA